MTEPITGCLEVQESYLSIDLLSQYEQNGDEWVYLYSIARVPIIPGHLMSSGQEDNAKGNISILSDSGGTDALGLKVAYEYNGVRKTKAISTREPGVNRYTTIVSPDTEAVEYPENSGCRYVVMEIGMKHAEQEEGAEACNATGMYFYWKSDRDPYAITTVKELEHYQETSIGWGQFDENSFVSAYDMMYGLSYNLNLLTSMNCGAFGCGILAVPFWGLEAPPA